VIPCDDPAVGRNAAAGPNQHHVADEKLRDRYQLGLSGRVDTFGVVREQLGERGERALCLSDRAHLEPVTEQHDRHQRRKLEPEIDVDPAELGRHGRAERDQQAHGDEQHHPGLAGFQLVPATAEEDGSAVQEDRSAEHGCDPPMRGDCGGRVVQPLLHHLAVGDRGDREEQTQPELAAEQRGVIAVALMLSVVHATRHEADGAEDRACASRRPPRIRSYRPQQMPSADISTRSPTTPRPAATRPQVVAPVTARRSPTRRKREPG
jgi:hypothetical protein